MFGKHFFLEFLCSGRKKILGNDCEAGVTQLSLLPTLFSSFLTNESSLEALP